MKNRTQRRVNAVPKAIASAFVCVSLCVSAVEPAGGQAATQPDGSGLPANTWVETAEFPKPVKWLSAIWYALPIGHGPVRARPAAAYWGPESASS